ncbi:hypothetical protein BG004_002175 [Podila humilis]|nr:hypothetical protein BG004_002175 [Podila humilis]
MKASRTSDRYLLHTPQQHHTHQPHQLLSTMSTLNIGEYFVTGPNQLLCEIAGVHQPEFPKTFQDSWDMDHVRLACSSRMYTTDVSLWPEIVEGLSQPIRTCQELSDIILRWNKAQDVNWNFNALDAFLNHRSDDELVSQAERLIDASTPAGESLDPLASTINSALTPTTAVPKLSIPKYALDVSASESDSDIEEQQLKKDDGDRVAVKMIEPLTSQFLSSTERTRFFDVILPRMQALALRLPELIKKPIPFLKQQQDSAITLSQEQIACLTANAFFNTFPRRNTPFKTRGYRRKWKPTRGASHLKKEQQDREHRQTSHGSHAEQQDEDLNSNEDEDEDEDEQTNNRKSKKGASSLRGGGRGGSSNNGRGGRGGKSAATGSLRPPKAIKRTPGPAGQFDFIEDSTQFPVETLDSTSGDAKASSSTKVKLLKSVQELTVKDTESQTQAGTSTVTTPTLLPTREDDERRGPKMPSINLVSMFWSEQTGKNACSDAQAAKLRCLIHYFDRVTSESKLAARRPT